MQTVDLPFFVELGTVIEQAQSLDDDGPLFDAFLALLPLRSHLKELLKGSHVRLSAAAHDLQELDNAIANFHKRYFTDEKGDWRPPDADVRAEYELSSIVRMIDRLKTVLIAELRTSTSFAVTGAGIFDVSLLVNGAHKALDRSTISVVGSAVCEELDAAGKCLAFNLHTAAGFHSMRAIERVIKLYLKALLDTDAIKKLKNWGQYIDALEKIPEDAERRASDEAIALIRQIKDIYRNPVIHPDRVLDAQEATTVFHGTIAAITRIASEISHTEPMIPGLFGKQRSGGGGGLGSFLSANPNALSSAAAENDSASEDGKPKTA